ncbi:MULTISPECIES: hypothetical protein [Aquitalea]|uniref:hypothetical protein n=1 Tax=Aquitalea TaxID=407217 RepID=UPI0011B54D34|nr:MULTISPECIES: hypothetical protein [Aquitalea]
MASPVVVGFYRACIKQGECQPAADGTNLNHHRPKMVMLRPLPVNLAGGGDGGAGAFMHQNGVS